MKLDDVLAEVGEFGPFQKRIYFFMCIPAATVGAVLLLNVIVLGVPEHRCKIPGLDNDTWDIQSAEHKDLVQHYIPTSDKYPYDRCHLYHYDNITKEHQNRTEIKCKEWVYDESVFKNTITKQVNLVCDDSLLVSDAQMVFYLGVLVGVITLGLISDLIGRKKSLYIGLLCLMVSATALSFTPTYYSFVAVYFFIGFCSLSSLLSAYVIGMEYVGPSKRLWTGTIIHMVGTTGSLYLLLMAYLLRDWQKIELCVGIPCVVYVFYICIIPESPRWLLRNGKKEEAALLLTKLADTNGYKLSEETLSALETEAGTAKGRLWQLFSTKTLAIRTSVIFINWLAVGMADYGVLLNVGNLGGNIYFNLFLITVVAYPSKIFTMTVLNRWGRKKVYIGLMLLGGVACLGTIIPVAVNSSSLNWLLVTLSVIGKMCVSSAFVVIYIFSTELFPTVVRNVGMGTSSAFARVGSMASPYIAQLAGDTGTDSGGAIPLIVFGAALLIGGLLAVVLPETLNKRLPDTIEDASTIDS